MVSHLFVYQLALIALAWLFFLLLYAWPRDCARRPHPAAPSAPRRPRSDAPTPCAGLPQRSAAASIVFPIITPMRVDTSSQRG
jgi:hypothetical protein